MKSNTVRLIELMSDNKFHSSKELNRIVGWNFKDKLFQLRQKGCIIERQLIDELFEWKLLTIPESLNIINGRIKNNIEKQKKLKMPEITYNWLDIVTVDTRPLWKKIFNIG